MNPKEPTPTKPTDAHLCHVCEQYTDHPITFHVGTTLAAHHPHTYCSLCAAHLAAEYALGIAMSANGDAQ